MSTEQGGTDRFLQTWVDEFGRAVEMFSGEAPDLRCSRSKKLGPSETEDLLWWKQEFSGPAKFTTRIGARKSTWVALGGGDETDAQSTYLEMLGQAQSGTAHVISGALGSPVQCEPGQVEAAPDLTGLLYGLVGIHLPSGELPSLVFAIDPAIEEILKDEEEEPAPALQAPSPADLITGAQQPMLSRLMELELPLSIALGRANIPIREVLKVTSGSVIELDRKVGESVELLVHGTVVARGEVVSVKGNYGVRINEIISQQDRMHLYKRN